MKIKYFADDGTEFDNNEECLAYENKNALINHIKENITTSYSAVLDTNVIQYEDVEKYIIDNYNYLWGILYSMNRLGASKIGNPNIPTIFSPDVVGIRDNTMNSSEC